MWKNVDLINNSLRIESREVKRKKVLKIKIIFLHFKSRKEVLVVSIQSVYARKILFFYILSNQLN